MNCTAVKMKDSSVVNVERIVVDVAAAGEENLASFLMI